MTTEFARALADALAERGMSLRAVGKLVGVSSSHLSNLRKGEARPSDELVERLAQLFGSPWDIDLREGWKYDNTHPDVWAELLRLRGDSGPPSLTEQALQQLAEKVGPEHARDLARVATRMLEVGWEEALLDVESALDLVERKKERREEREGKRPGGGEQKAEGGKRA